jgi:hypothetical protein
MDRLLEAKAEVAALQAAADTERRVRDELKAEIEDLQAEAKAERQKSDRMRAVALRLHEQRLASLQHRLEALGEANLLSDDELYAVEDIIADAAEAPEDDDQVAMLLALSMRMTADGAFARQLRRKVVARGR